LKGNALDPSGEHGRSSSPEVLEFKATIPYPQDQVKAVAACFNTDGSNPLVGVTGARGWPPERSAGLACVLGTSYTGSTLLAFLLNAHPAVASVGDLNAAMNRLRTPDYRCSCHAHLQRCDFWRDVSDRMDLRGMAFGPRRWDTSFTLGTNPFARQLLVRSLRSDLLEQVRGSLLSRSPTWGVRLREIGARNAALFGSVIECTGKSMLVDTCKDPMRVRFLMDFTRLVPKVIHLVRHPVGFVSSNVKHGNTLGSSIRAWNRRQGQILRLRPMLSRGGWLTLRYEDLCLRTSLEVGRVLGFLGAEPAAAWMDRLSGQEHHILGNEMRLRWPADIQLDLSWRSRLSNADVEMILLRTRRWRGAFGYKD
jgi:hypothetical protein